MSYLPEMKIEIPAGIVVIGAGNWGTTLAALLAPHRSTRLWTHSREHADQINQTGINGKYLPEVALPSQLDIEPFGASPMAMDDLILIAVPSHQVRMVAQQLQPDWNGQIVVNSAKGFEHHSMKTLSQVIEDVLPDVQLVVWSGPNIAHEIALGKPARAVLAGRNMSVLSRTARCLRNDGISFEISRDVRGVELCASLKGILAIAIGIADGLELGDNFIGLLISYGLGEFAAIAEFMGIPKATIYGIAGLGDCLTSSLSPYGRNRRFGRLIGKNTQPEDAMQQVGMVVEGVQMMMTITELEDLNVATPLFSMIKRIIFDPNGDIRDLIVETVMNYNVYTPSRIPVMEELV